MSFSLTQFSLEPRAHRLLRLTTIHITQKKSLTYFVVLRLLSELGWSGHKLFQQSRSVKLAEKATVLVNPIGRF